MLFIIIRFVFWSLFLVICCYLIKKSHVIRKRKWLLIAFVTIVLLITASDLIPVENIFVTFPSPESAYNYNNSGDVKLVVDGEKTDFIVGLKGDTTVYTIVPKSEGGWKLGMALNTKRVFQMIYDGIIIYVYQYQHSDDYYVTVLDTNGGKLEITDNRDSKFQYMEQENSVLNESFYTYYTYIKGFDDQYTLTVNDKVIRSHN